VADYTDLATLKLALGITDTARDELLASAITAASEAIDQRTDRRFDLDPSPVARVFRPRGRVVRDDDGELLLVDDIGDTAGLVVEVGSAGSWTALSGFETSPENALAKGKPITGLLLPAGAWPTGSGRIRVTARWGWPAIPAGIEQAARIQATRLYRRKDTPEGVAGSAEWGVMRLAKLDPDVHAMTEPYVLPGFA